jgi:hypothetical protein
MSSSDEYFDSELIEVMRQALEEAWVELSLEQQAQTMRASGRTAEFDPEQT